MLKDQLINRKRCIITVNDLVLFWLYDLSLWKWTFPEGLGGWGVGGEGGVLWKITKGLGGHQPPTKMENPGRWQGPKWNSLNSVGLDTEPLDVEFVDECSVQRK